MTAAVHEIYPPEPDLDMAVGFLKAINPDGRQMLVGQTDESNGKLDTQHRLFEAGHWNQKKALIAAWAAERRNIWVLPNEPKAGGGGKEGDIAFIRCVWSDTDNKAVQAEALASGASFVTDSGGGIHTFFVLGVPAPVGLHRALAERVGRGLQAGFKGDPVWNINRPMRVPGTINYLNAKKRAAGRQIAKTFVLAANGRKFTLDEVLALYPAPASAAPAAAEEAPDIPMDDATGDYTRLDAELVRRFEATWIFRGLWARGVVKGDDTGSGRVFQLGLGMRGLGFSAREFAAIATCWDLVLPENVTQRQLSRVWHKAGKQAARVFDDGGGAPPEEMPKPAAAASWSFPAAGDKPEHLLKRRDWLYGRRLIRGYLSSTVAAGGTGKSSLTMAEGVAMASGKNILQIPKDDMPKDALRVLIWNGEDPQQELDLRLAAIMKRHQVNSGDLGSRLYVVSGRDYPLAEAGGMGRLVEFVRGAAIDVVMIDPFVSSHSAPENDNVLIDKVAKAWSRIAEDCRCAVDLVHHIRKPANGVSVDLTVDDARGASALINASRNARVIVPMSEDMARSHGIGNRRAYIGIQHDATKANMVPAGVGASWFHFVSVPLDNGDMFSSPAIEGDVVGVVEAWKPTLGVAEDPAKVTAAVGEMAGGSWRKDHQSADWVGIPIAKALDLPLPENEPFVKKIIKKWLGEGLLKISKKPDANRHLRDFVEPGNPPSEVEF